MRRIAAVLLALAIAPFAKADTITVFAAASLKESLDAAAKPFEAATGNKVVVSYAGSNALARQIEAGAPATLFISADLAWVDYVEKRGLTIAGTRVNLLGNDLVLIAPTASTASVKIAPGFELAKALGDGRLALANPDAVPAGKYAKAALTSLGAWAGVENHVAPAENVRAALALVSRNEAPFGIVYRTDAMADHGVRIVDTFPQGGFPAIVYPMVELKGSAPGTHALARYLASPATREVWEHYGFRVLQ
ncbi:MAG TPA: molybdate ABC transporter substrate-binding protein [Usitatibacter sp.]|nr:molybdate ABC transporter substrate-binding protein [Usitatibacter sp.]